jgi:hypothetical protein
MLVLVRALPDDVARRVVAADDKDDNATFLCKDSRISPVTFLEHHVSLGLCIFGWILLMR